LTEFSIKDLNQILERDATDTTYKFALLRAVSDVCQRHDPLKDEEGWAWFPTGYLIEKWLQYYYPIIDSEVFVPQKGSEKDLDKPGYKIAFRSEFSQLTDYYKKKGGLDAFWFDYKKGRVSSEINAVCLDLLKNLYYTITRYPMKHLGYSSTGEHYAFFKYSDRNTISKKKRVSQSLVLEEFGEFGINSEFYRTLRLFGSYISGEYSILNKWVDFTVHADSSAKVEPAYVFELLNEKPEPERDVLDARNYYQELFMKQDGLKCVWSDTKIRSWQDVHIDHMIPYSIWGNNDLWNLLPSHQKVNSQKKDLIPSIRLLENREKSIISYWKLLEENFRYRFNKEAEYNLLDSRRDSASMDVLFEKLLSKCEYLIDVRGFSEWNLRG